MYFNDKKSNNNSIDKRLLWEFNVDKTFDWQKMKKTVVKRVIEMGSIDDFYAMFSLYGGIQNVISIIKEISFLNRRDINFVENVFKIKKEELACYTKMQSMKKPILY